MSEWRAWLAALMTATRTIAMDVQPGWPGWADKFTLRLQDKDGNEREEVSEMRILTAPAPTALAPETMAAPHPALSAEPR